MKAMIFAAGLGTRLRPLTNNTPKALVEVRGIPLLEIAIKRLKKFNCEGIIINIHHFGDQILDFLDRNQNFGMPIEISDERDLLLETGGGLKKAAWFLSEAPFIVYNVDILNNLNLQQFYQQHIKNNALATLAVRHRESSRHLLFSENGMLSGWRHNKTGEEKISRPEVEHEGLAFSGLHVISPDIFKHMPDQEVFSIIDIYLEAAKNNLIQAMPHDDGIWLDVGKPDQLERAHKIIEQIDIDLNLQN